MWHLWHQEKREFERNEDFQDKMDEIVSGNKFDIIMCFQFVNEFYRKGKYEKFHPLYKTMTELADRYLKKDGLFILSDVTDAIDENDNGSFFPKLMNKEIIKYLQKETGLKCILPLSCAFYYGKCKHYAKCFQQKIYPISILYGENLPFKDTRITFRVAFKVFTHRELSAKILDKEKIKEIYEIRSYDGKRFCGEGEYKFENDLSLKEQQNAADAFTLSSSLKQTK